MAYFLGLDGGGTRTTGWIAGEGESIAAKAVAGPSNPLKVGFDASEREIHRAATRALRQARLRPGALEAVCLGLAGADRPAVHRRLLTWIRRSIPARFHAVTSDAAIALEAALGAAPGIIVISGTGSVAYGRDSAGNLIRAGGWGAAFDDAGSGYDLGRKAIAAALRAHDGRGPRTRLGAQICRALGLRDITAIAARQLAPHEVAALFPLGLQAAQEGDTVARRLCEDAGHDLADLGLALLRRLRSERHAVRVVCAGGVFAASLAVRRSFSRHLHRFAPRAQVTLLRRSPVEGALELARRISRA